MKGLFYLAIVILLVLAVTNGLRFCYKDNCHEIKIEVLNK